VTLTEKSELDGGPLNPEYSLFRCLKCFTDDGVHTIYNNPVCATMKNKI